MNSTLPVLQDNQTLVRQLERFGTLKELHASAFFTEHQSKLESILNTPDINLCPDATPRIRDFLRIAHWNIERGNNFDGVLHYLRTIQMLATADLLFLNELDVGMVRTGNRHVAKDLGQALGYHVAYVPEYLEMTKGVGDERDLSGENTTALHGNAILSRYPISQTRIIELPSCFEPFEFHEKRYGRRIAIVVDLDVNGRNVTAITSHLEVRNTPSCRMRQMQQIMSMLDAWKIKGSVIFGGDFNSNSFARGTRLRTLGAASWLLRKNPAEVKHKLLHPEEGAEPLFLELRKHGFQVREFNTEEHTARIPIKMVEEAGHLPSVAQNWVHKRLSVYGHELLMRLDWICGRGVRALKEGEIADHLSGITSAAPQTFRGLYYNERRASDHAAIAADIVIE